jgi:pantothenate kinase type III
MPKYILTIDQGNTYTKLALFDRSADLDSRKVSIPVFIFPLEQLDRFIESYAMSDSNTIAILSSVKKETVEVPFKTINIKDYFKPNLFIDMPVFYSDTLGIDRLALAYPIYKKYKNAICIDSGTFTTVDFIDQDGFQGGYILPGLGLIKSCYNKGENLYSPPLNTTHNINFSEALPESTQEAISQGALISAMSPIREIIHREPQAEIFLTGGNAKFLTNVDRLIICNENLMHESLFFIAKEII